MREGRRPRAQPPLHGALRPVSRVVEPVDARILSNGGALAVRVMLIGAQLYEHKASVSFSGLPFKLWLHHMKAQLVTWDCLCMTYWNRRPHKWLTDSMPKHANARISELFGETKKHIDK